MVVVGKVKAPFAEADAHYRKMLQRHQPVEVIEVRDEVNLEGRIPRRSHVIALDRGGRALSSKAWASWLSERRIDAQDLCFLIGGPEGLSARTPWPSPTSASRSARRRWPISSPGSCCWSSSSAPPRSWPASRTTSSAARRLQSMADPVAELRSAVEAAAASLLDGAEAPAPSRRSSGHPSPSSATTRPTPRCCWRPPSASSREGPRRSSPRSSARALEGTVERVEVAGPGLPQPLPGGRLVPARRDRARRAGGPAGQAARRRRGDRAGQRRVRLGQPDRPGDGGERAPRGLRRLGRPAARVHRPPRGARVLRQRPRRPDRPLRASRSPRA